MSESTSRDLRMACDALGDRWEDDPAIAELCSHGRKLADQLESQQRELEAARWAIDVMQRIRTGDLAELVAALDDYDYRNLRRRTRRAG